MDDRWLGLVVITAAVFAAAAVGGSLSGDGKLGWYAQRRRWGLPPLRAVGPAWTVLFGCLAGATWLVWIEYGTWEFGYLAPYVGLTALSAYWPIALFGKRHPGRAAGLGVVIAVTAGGTAERYAADVPLAAALTAVFAAGAVASAVGTGLLWWSGRSRQSP